MSEPSDKPKFMKISQAAQAAGVSRQTVEYYILVGLIRPLRSDTGRRQFDTRLVRRIKLIRRLNRSGYTLRSIRETYLQGKGE